MWLNDNLIENIFVQWDFDSILPSINFLYSDTCKNSYFKVDTDTLDNSNSKVNKLFYKNISQLRDSFIQKQEFLIGKSSNNSYPNQGVKIIANSFEQMNKKNDELFNSALYKYPYFKLTYRGFPSGKLTDVFHKDSKLIKLIFDMV